MKAITPCHSDTQTCTTCPERRTGWFCALGNEVLSDLELQSTSKRLDIKAPIFSQGGLPTHIHIVCSGYVKLTVKRGSGHQAVARVAPPGSILGLSAVQSNREYELSAHALTPVLIRSVVRESFLNLLNKWPEIQQRALNSICQDYLSAHQQFCRAVLSATVDERLNQLLFDMADVLDADSEESGVRVPFLLTQSEIATMIGTTRESVSRSMRELRKRGSISMTNSGVVLRGAGIPQVLA